jgi:hypothetical protein
VQPNAMWVDVEGAIGIVLQGASESLDHCQVLYAEIEQTARWQGQLLDIEVVQLLLTHGLVPLARDVQRRGWQYNCIFIRPSLLSEPKVLQIMREFISV